MKKKIAAAILTATLLIAGCESVNVSTEQDVDSIVVDRIVVDHTDNYTIYADKDTGVMYLFVGGGYKKGGGLTVMLNADGTPKIWNGESE